MYTCTFNIDDGITKTRRAHRHARTYRTYVRAQRQGLYVCMYVCTWDWLLLYITESWTHKGWLAQYRSKSMWLRCQRRCLQRVRDFITSDVSVVGRWVRFIFLDILHMSICPSIPLHPLPHASRCSPSLSFRVRACVWLLECNVTVNWRLQRQRRVGGGRH